MLLLLPPQTAPTERQVSAGAVSIAQSSVVRNWGKCRASYPPHSSVPGLGGKCSGSYPRTKQSPEGQDR
jgi:hypothetical protein